MDPLTAVSAVPAVRGQSRAPWAPEGHGAPTPSSFANADTQTALSPSAQLLEAVLTATVPGDAALARLTPLLPGPPGADDGDLLAKALQDGLEHSGLFYEAHLSEWVRGGLPLEMLLTEPQARLPALALPAPAADIGDQAPPSANRTPPPNAASYASDAGLPAEDDAPIGGAGGGAWQHQVDPRTAGLVQQQLLALDTQTVPWQGEIWPGQTLQWDTRRDTDPERSPGAHARPDPVWTSMLRLALPALGALDAELRMNGEHCSLLLHCPSASLPRLRAALPALAGAMAAAGLRPDQLRIRPQEPPDEL